MQTIFLLHAVTRKPLLQLPYEVASELLDMTAEHRYMGLTSAARQTIYRMDEFFREDLKGEVTKIVLDVTVQMSLFNMLTSMLTLNTQSLLIRHHHRAALIESTGRTDGGDEVVTECVPFYSDVNTLCLMLSVMSQALGQSYDILLTNEA